MSRLRSEILVSYWLSRVITAVPTTMSGCVTGAEMSPQSGRSRRMPELSGNVARAGQLMPSWLSEDSASRPVPENYNGDLNCPCRIHLDEYSVVHKSSTLERHKIHHCNSQVQKYTLLTESLVAVWLSRSSAQKKLSVKAKIFPRL